MTQCSFTDENCLQPSREALFGENKNSITCKKIWYFKWFTDLGYLEYHVQGVPCWVSNIKLTGCFINDTEAGTANTTIAKSSKHFQDDKLLQ